MRNRQLSKKAQGEGHDSDEDSSSEGKTDHLSYSYSCVKSFRRNQHIIADLAALCNKQDYHGISHQPALYSLSGPRNQPIYQPYYCSNTSENNSDEEYENDMVPLQGKMREEYAQHLVKSESQNQIPVKHVLVQWLKHQLKQVNSLWSYAIPKDIFIPKFCKRSQKMKMEMTLNGVDEVTKHKLIDYINKLNLGFEEHCNICTGNETVIEIDVTSILDDSQRLQSFLTFLKSINSEKSKEQNAMDNSDMNNHVDIDKGVGIFGKMPLQQQKPCNKAKRFRETVTYQRKKLSVKSESDEKIAMKLNPIAFKPVNNYQKEVSTIISPKKENERDEEAIKVKRTRQITTVSGKNVKKFLNNNNTLLEPIKLNHEHNVYNLQTKIANDASKFVKGEFSCKCLIHNNREDFNRYKNQCLFGNGDELNNSYIKYLNKKKNISEQYPGFDDYQHNDFVNINVKEEGFEKPYINVKSDKFVDRTYNRLQKDVTESFKNTNITFSKDGITPIRPLLNDGVTAENRAIGAFDDTFSLNMSSSGKKDKDNKDVKVIAKNACFKSVSYCLDSFPVNNDSCELHLGDNTRHGNQFYFSNQKSYQGGSDMLEKSYIKPTGNINTKENRQITQNNSPNICNLSMANQLHLTLKDPDLDVNTCIQENIFENFENKKTNYTRNNERNSQHYNNIGYGYGINSDYGINKEYVRDHQRLQSSISNSCVPNMCKTYNNLLSGIPTNEMGSTKLCSLVHKKSKCCIFGCDCENAKRKSKIRTIVFRIGPTAKEQIKPSSNPPTIKSCKVKSLKPKKVYKKISSVFKGNEPEKSDKSLSLILNSGIANKTLCYSTVRDKSCVNKTDSSSSSWINIEDYVSITDPPTSRSKGTTPTQNSVDTDASQIENSIGILISELQNQRMEIDYLKNVLHNKIT